MKDDTVIVAKFMERTPKWVLLEGHKLHPGAIKAFTIVKGNRL